MILKYIWLLGASIFLILGTIHLIYTFYSNKFSSRNTKVIEEMKSSRPILTNETTIWKAWIGFNASHSSGAMFIGILNIYLALLYFDTIVNNTFFYLINIITTFFYLWLAKKYWFKIPFLGILTSFLCFLSVFIVSVFK